MPKSRGVRGISDGSEGPVGPPAARDPRAPGLANHVCGVGAERRY